MNITRILFTTILHSLLIAGSAWASDTLPFKPNDRVILLGNTFADRMRHYGYFETLLQQHYPKLKLRFRNMGWSADEVGLQPRPLNFPGFGQSEIRNTSAKGEVTFEGFTHEGGKITMPVALNLKGLNQDLTEQKADVILLCFGMNEAFKGVNGLPQFEKDLDAFIRNLQSNQYNGRSAPTLILVSPIAHETLGGYLPDPAEHNKNLELYTKAMQKMAVQKGIRFVDLFTPSQNYYNKTPLTINGIHLNDTGYQQAARWMTQALGLNIHADFNTSLSKTLRSVVKMKDDHFFYRWRAVNGEYIYGRRREPFGVIAYPPELRKLNQMVTALDSLIWQMALQKDERIYNKALDITDRRDKPVDPDLLPTVAMTGKQMKAAGNAHHHTPETVWPTTTDSFKLPEGYNINLFASEKNFPIEKPVAMNFDARGRLWVATMPTYPQYYPGIPVHDKIVILEDTDSDGQADKHTLFADDLYLPLGFEFGNGGVYVSQEPDILFLKDTDGDDKADVREVILTGFGSEDSHHATHAFTFGQDGALYFNEGTFLNSQIETPYGPIRSYAGATYRYEPRTQKLQHYVSYPYYNPWGSVFDRWGTHLIGDASDGSNYFAPPMTARVDYPAKHPRMNMFTETRVRPTAGIEIVSSRNFPDDVQGNFLVNNNIGFQGTKQHRIIPKGSGITSKEVEPILQSTDPNFRPIDLKFGPDGGMYIVDWYNPLISHGENPPRDPARDKSHGRIWRITYSNKPLVNRVDLSKMGIAELLDNLKVHEDRHRYRARIQLRQQQPSELLSALDKWVDSLNPNNPEFELLQLEALWLYQDIAVVKESLLKKLLHAKDYRARAAATKVLRHWHEHIPNALALMRERINDESPRVRLEAVVALSHFDNEKAVSAVMDIFQYSTDYYLDYAIRETLLALKPYWLVALKAGRTVSGKPNDDHHLLALASVDELSALPQTVPVLAQLLTRKELDLTRKQVVVHQLAQATQTTAVEVLLGAIRQSPLSDTGHEAHDLIRLLLQSDRQTLQANVPVLMKLISEDTSRTIRTAAYAAIITAEQSDQTVYNVASQRIANLTDYLTALNLLTDERLKKSFYPKLKGFTQKLPEGLAAVSQPRGVGSATYWALFNTYRLLLTTGDMQSRTSTFRDYMAYLNSTPKKIQETQVFANAVAEAKNLTKYLPETNRPEMLAALDAMGTMEIRLVAIEAKMAFDKQQLTVPAGKSVVLLFENPDLMPHNVVILKPGTTEKVGHAADAMATLKDGFEKHFVPDTPDVLFATPLVNSGKSYRLNFKAPQQPGDYPFICSFPGHWQVMKGILTVK